MEARGATMPRTVPTTRDCQPQMCAVLRLRNPVESDLGAGSVAAGDTAELSLLLGLFPPWLPAPHPLCVTSTSLVQPLVASDAPPSSPQLLNIGVHPVQSSDFISLPSLTPVYDCLDPLGPFPESRFQPRPLPTVQVQRC